MSSAPKILLIVVQKELQATRFQHEYQRRQMHLNVNEENMQNRAILATMFIMILTNQDQTRRKRVVAYYQKYENLPLNRGIYSFIFYI